MAERDAARVFAGKLRNLGCLPRLEDSRAPTSPTWVPLIRALLRVWAVAFVAAFMPLTAAVFASLAIVAGLDAVGGLLRFVPLLGDTTTSVVARIDRRADGDTRPIVITAHLDTHPTAGAPMSRAHAALAAVSGWVALAIALAGRPGIVGWRIASALVAVESVATLAWLARRELTTPREMPDDNTSGILALLRGAELVCTSAPARDVWIVASGAGTCGSYGLAGFLRRRRELRGAWVVEIDALGAGEVVATPFPARFPYPGTPSALVRAVVAAARETGDPLSVRRVRRPHSDARAALRLRTPAIALTAGLRPPAGEPGPDQANAERAARVVDGIARLVA